MSDQEHKPGVSGSDDCARIRFCIHNVTKEDHAMLELEGAEPHDCFGRCGACFERAYLVTGDRDAQSITEDDVVEAEDAAGTHAELLARIRDRREPPDSAANETPPDPS